MWYPECLPDEHEIGSADAAMERDPTHEAIASDEQLPGRRGHRPLLILLVMPQPSHAGEPSPALTKEQASAFARLALKGLSKEYPNKPEHVMAGPADVKDPRPSTRRSSGRTTGTRPCTATGCWCGCSACSPT